MLHLPGLKHLKELESSLQGIAHHGLTVRGFYGENSDFSGDFYQISNEVTMGRPVEDIVATLKEVVERLIQLEENARLELFRHHETAVSDSVWRAYGVLAYARRLDSAEAMRLLSMIRLGIDKGWFGKLDHQSLNRLVLEIQPSHLQRLRSRAAEGNGSRDEARAAFLRDHIEAVNDQN